MYGMFDRHVCLCVCVCVSVYVCVYKYLDTHLCVYVCEICYTDVCVDRDGRIAPTHSAPSCANLTVRSVSLSTVYLQII